jgi:short-subunit dehydrogenase
MESFSGKIVWITGASSGIGEALVKAFATHGAKIILTARRESELLRVKKEAGLSDENSLILPLDLYHTEGIAQSVEKIRERFGGIDILVCNAGIAQRFSVNESTMEVNRQLMELNFFSVIAITKSVLPDMLKRKSGRIVVISSVMGKIGMPGSSMYGASKHALHGFFDALRVEVYRDNIGVTVVCPGYIKTNVSINAVTAEGSAHGKMDKGQEHGMLPEKCAAGILKAVARGKDEYYIGGKEMLALTFSRLFPSLFLSVVKRVASKKKNNK